MLTTSLSLTNVANSDRQSECPRFPAATHNPSSSKRIYTVMQSKHGDARGRHALPCGLPMNPTSQSL